jgi:hypothetical protein
MTFEFLNPTGCTILRANMQNLQLKGHTTASAPYAFEFLNPTGSGDHPPMALSFLYLSPTTWLR